MRITIDQDCPNCGYPELIGDVETGNAGQFVPIVKFCNRCSWRKEYV